MTATRPSSPAMSHGHIASPSGIGMSTGFFAHLLRLAVEVVERDLTVGLGVGCAAVPAGVGRVDPSLAVHSDRSEELSRLAERCGVGLPALTVVGRDRNATLAEGTKKAGLWLQGVDQKLARPTAFRSGRRASR